MAQCSGNVCFRGPVGGESRSFINDGRILNLEMGLKEGFLMNSCVYLFFPSSCIYSLSFAEKKRKKKAHTINFFKAGLTGLVPRAL